MELPADNPIVTLWRDVQSSGGSLEDAQQRAADPAFASRVAEGAMTGVDEALAADAAGADAVPLADVAVAAGRSP